MVRPIYSFLNINNLRNNFFLIQKLSGNKNIWLVIKGDAYGHGIKNIFDVLKDYVDGFSVLSINEAIYLRNIGWKKGILLLEGFFDFTEIELCIKYNISSVIHSFWQINFLKKIRGLYNKIDIYLKLNVNLNRLGFNYSEINKVFYILKSINIIKNLSLIIHLSLSSRYNNIIFLKNKYYKIFNLNFKDISISSSLALILNINDIYSTWVRIGILLYGLSPTGNMNDVLHLGFKPVMTFLSKIISIKYIKKNQYIGYNNGFYTNKNRLIGVVACGYADGYPRQLSNKYFVLVKNIFKAQILGYISMDMMIIDLLDNKDINIGDNVELWGENIYVDDLARIANTVGYDLICGLNKNRVILKLK